MLARGASFPIEVNDSLSADDVEERHLCGSGDGISRDCTERRILSEVKDADERLRGLRACLPDATDKDTSLLPQAGNRSCGRQIFEHARDAPNRCSPPPRQASGSFAAADLASMPSTQSQPSSPKVSSVVKRVVEATGHGLEQLLGQEHRIGPAPVWATSSHAVRPTSSCVLETYRRSYKDVQLCLTFSSPDYTPTLVTVQHSQSPTSDFRVLGVADVKKTSEACTHIIAFPEHKQQLLRFVRVQLRYCHGPRLHGVCKHEVSAISLQGIPTVRRSVHNISRRLWRGGIQIKSALRTPQFPGGRRRRSSLRPARDVVSPKGAHIFEAHAGRWGMADVAPEVLRDDSRTRAQKHDEYEDLTPRCHEDAPHHTTPPTLCPHTQMFHTPSSGFHSSKGTTPNRPEAFPKKCQPPPLPPPLPPHTHPGYHVTSTDGANNSPVQGTTCKPTRFTGKQHGKACSPAPPPPPLPQKKLSVKPASVPPPPPPPPSRAAKNASGPPPPPPPPPPGRNGRAQGSAIADQTAVQQAEPGPAPTKKTVRLFWKKMADPTKAEQPTVWSDVAALPVSKARRIDSEMKLHAGPAASVLDMDRARNVGVLMRSLKMDASAIQAALHASLSHDAGDQRRLEEFEIEGILAAFPSVAEAQQLQSLGGRRPTKEEFFLLQLLGVPTLKQMLGAAKHMRAAAAAIESVRIDVRTIAQACSDVQNSETLRKVLRYTLSMGNFLNSGSKDACAAAFHVEDLLKLKEVKGSGGMSGCKSLLHFLAKQLLQDRQEAVSDTHITPPKPGLDASAAISAIRDELAGCGPASKMDVTSTTKSISDALASLSQLKKLLGEFQSSSADVKGEVVESLAKSIDQVEGEVDVLRRSWSKQMQAFAQLVAYLKGLKPSTTPSELFQLIHSFLKDLEAAMSDVADANRRAARAAASPACTAGSPFTSSGVEHSPIQMKDGVVKQMQAFCRLTPEVRRERLAQAGAERRLISESINVRKSLRRPDMSAQSATRASQLRSSKTPAMAARAKLRGGTPRGSRITPRGRLNPQIWGFEGVRASRHPAQKSPARPTAVSNADDCLSPAPATHEAEAGTASRNQARTGTLAWKGVHADLPEDRPLTAMRDGIHACGGAMALADAAAPGCRVLGAPGAASGNALQHRLRSSYAPGQTGPHRYDGCPSLTTITGTGQVPTRDTVDSSRKTPTKPFGGTSMYASPLAASSRLTARVKSPDLAWHGSPAAQRRPGSLTEQRDRPLASLASEQRPQSVQRLPARPSTVPVTDGTPASVTGSCSTPSPERHELRELRMQQVPDSQSVVITKSNFTTSKLLAYGRRGPANVPPAAKKSSFRTQDILARARQAVADDI